ncbi:MAG: CBS domain-containing protein [candidate division NC10 bacterium]|nr:CBS domain-containing protein [candidate division NC10 bacterium]
MQVVDRMTPQVVVASPSGSVRAAWGLLREHQIRHLPVVEDGRLVGIITDRDIRLVFPSALTSVHREEDPYDALEKVTVKEIMTERVVTVAPEASIADATRLLLEKRIGGLPVVEGDRLVGMITKDDILAAFVEIIE